MSDPILFVFLFFAVAIGWLLGRWGAGRRKQADLVNQTLKQPYIIGLNFLLNDQPDGAIDAFIAALEVNSETMETHLAIGNLSRRRGETDRAIRVHQNLLARPSLSRAQQQKVQFELALDYTKAGWLDRAERILKELITQGSSTDRAKVLATLIDIYQQEQEWDQALPLAQQYMSLTSSEESQQMAVAASHYCCEIAAIAISEQRFHDAEKNLRLALQLSATNARASILKAQAQLGLGRDRKALSSLKKMADIAPDKLIEAMPLLEQIFANRGEKAGTLDFIREFAGQDESGALGTLLFEQIRKHQGDEQALEYLRNRRSGQARLAELLQVLQIETAKPDGADAVNLNALAELLLVEEQQRWSYRCRQCGFGGNQLHWLCPGCKSWGTVHRD
ncbi:MAG: lipopolysaccharide assembly protein LapB [Pseudomonadota bacterium]